eukprot:scaffold8916_cov122-Isochrysis_galbana.AAC.1
MEFLPARARAMVAWMASTGLAMLSSRPEVSCCLRYVSTWGVCAVRAGSTGSGSGRARQARQVGGHTGASPDEDRWGEGMYCVREAWPGAPRLLDELCVVRSVLVEPKGGCITGGTGARHRKLDPITDRSVLGLYGGKRE